MHIYRRPWPRISGLYVGLSLDQTVEYDPLLSERSTGSIPLDLYSEITLLN